MLLLLLILLVPLAVQSAKVLPNIDLLGAGYELAKSSPRPVILPFDPGFRAPVFDTSLRQNRRLTADQRFVVPRFVDAVECAACQSTSDVNAMSNFDEYKTSQKNQLGTGFGVKIPLSAPAAFEEVAPLMSPTIEIGYKSNYEHRVAEEEYSSQSQMRVESVALCSAYCASISTFNLSNGDFSPNFLEAVNQLRPNRGSYGRFVDTFGTHFISGITFGSSLYRVVKFDSTEYTKLTQKYDSIEKSLSLSIGVSMKGEDVGWGFGLSETSFASEEELKSISAATLSAQDYTVGAVPKPGTLKAWQNDSSVQAMPIFLQLTPIAALFTSQMFPFDYSIDKKRRWITSYNLGQDYEDYLDGIESGQNMVESADMYGGTYADNFMSSSAVPNPFTAKKSCPGGYDRIALLMKRNSDRISNFYLCNDPYAELTGPFGGLFSQFWRTHCPLICKPGSETLSDQGFVTCNTADKVPDLNACKTYLSDETDSSSYDIAVNPLTRDASCPPDFAAFKLAHVNECNISATNPCANTALRIDIMACFNRDRFAKGYSNIGGFYSYEGLQSTIVARNPITNSDSCPDGYKSHLVTNGHDDGRGYACVMEQDI